MKFLELYAQVGKKWKPVRPMKLPEKEYSLLNKDKFCLKIIEILYLKMDPEAETSAIINRYQRRGFLVTLNPIYF